MLWVILTGEPSITSTSGIASLMLIKSLEEVRNERVARAGAGAFTAAARSRVRKNDIFSAVCEDVIWN